MDLRTLFPNHEKSSAFDSFHWSLCVDVSSYILTAYTSGLLKPWPKHVKLTFHKSLRRHWNFFPVTCLRAAVALLIRLISASLHICRTLTGLCRKRGRFSEGHSKGTWVRKDVYVKGSNFALVLVRPWTCTDFLLVHFVPTHSCPGERTEFTLTCCKEILAHSSKQWSIHYYDRSPPSRYRLH